MKINDIEYLKLDLVKINQKGHTFHVAKAPAEKIVKMFTVSPAEYDINKFEELAESKNEDEREYYNAIIENKKKQTDFQREKDTTRVNKISEYINSNEFAFFPNTIICTIDCISIPEGTDTNAFIEKEQDNVSSTSSFYIQEDQKVYVLIPIIKDSILVIDGQHRLEGLKEYIKQHSPLDFEYDVLLSLFIGFDRAIVAQQFYTINYEQKSVNKSILYHLMGEFSDEIDEITILHNFTRLLNEHSKSPYYRRIKMLGRTPKNEDNKHMYSISQAFVIDELLKTISSKSVNSVYQPCFLYYFKKENQQIDIIKFIMRFFNAVKHIRPDWDDPTNSILSKGLGFAALIKVLQFMIPILFLDRFQKDTEKLIQISKDEIILLLEGLQDVDLSVFGGQGGAGSISKIKEVLIENLTFFDCNNYEDFESNYKKEYLEKFKSWNKQHIK